MAGIYVHIPFCRKACHYCDFHFSTNTKRTGELVSAIVQEIELQKDYLGHESLNTIYFGGGTPSVLSGHELKLILHAITNSFRIDPSVEVTIEANPDDLSREKLDALRTLGFNRLSIGIQSFDDNILHFLNRVHNSDMSINSFRNARHAGFNNISIDMMYAIPGQDLAMWKKNIDHAIELYPEHISCYSLTIEDKTVFGNWAAQKRILPTDEDSSANQFLTLIDSLEHHGYEHYEVSNFAKPGFMSRHNSSYWKGDKYLGIGPSAHSYDGISRQYNVSNNALYVTEINSGKIPSTVEILTREDKINDWILTSIRTSWGTDLEKLRNEYHYDLTKVHSRYLDTLVEGNLAVVSDRALILTKSGRLLADKIATDLFA